MTELEKKLAAVAALVADAESFSSPDSFVQPTVALLKALDELAALQAPFRLVDSEVRIR